SERLDRLDDRLRAPDRACRSVERGEESVTGRVALIAAEPRQLAAHYGVVPGQQVAPCAITELIRTRRRPDDVGEEHGCQDAVGYRPLGLAGDEPFEFVGDVERQEDAPVVAAGDAHRSGARDER